MEYQVIEEVLYRPTGTKYIYVVKGIDNDYIGEGQYTYPEAVIELAGLYGVSEKEVKKAVNDYYVYYYVGWLSFSVQDVYDEVDKFYKENGFKTFKEADSYLLKNYDFIVTDNRIESAYGYVEDNIKEIKKVYSEYSENDYGDDVSNMDNGELALYLGISEQEVEDDRESAEEQARDLMNDPEQDF